MGVFQFGSVIAFDQQELAFATQGSANSREDAIWEHMLAMRTQTVLTEMLGEGIICASCSLPIQGILCCNSLQEPLHYGCAGCPAKNYGWRQRKRGCTGCSNEASGAKNFGTINLQWYALRPTRAA